MRLPLALLAAALPLAVAAQVYRWVDEKGVVHYTQTPPPGFDAKKLDEAPPPPANTPIEQLRDYNAANAQARSEREAAAAKAAQAEAERQRACAAAQRRIQFLQNHPPQRIKRKDESGDVVRMSPEDHARDLDKARSVAAQACG